MTSTVIYNGEEFRRRIRALSLAKLLELLNSEEEPGKLAPLISDAVTEAVRKIRRVEYIEMLMAEAEEEIRDLEIADRARHQVKPEERTPL